MSLRPIPDPSSSWQSSVTDLFGLPLARITEEELISHIDHSLTKDQGGWVVTANLDILYHFQRDALARDAYLAASLRVADGMPLVWAAALLGEPLPGRIAGSTLTERLLARALERKWSVLLLGGAPGAAERVVSRHRTRHPDFPLVGDSSVAISLPPTEQQVEAVVQLVREHGSRLVLVGLGSPKQEVLIQRVRSELPGVWFIGVGGTFRFLTGEVRRAPEVVQRMGLEWTHRLLQEPRRLARRYLVDNLPLFVRLMAYAVQQRRHRRSA